MTTRIDDPRPAVANLADLVRAAAAAAPERPALMCPQTVRSWGELDRAVDVGAGALAAAGLDPGDRIVLALPTGPSLASALFAALRAGLIAVPVGPGRTALPWVAERVGARAVVTDEDLDAPQRLSSADIAAWWTGDAAPPVTGQAAGEDIAVLARAGREGPPVMLSHRALVAAARALNAAPQWSMRPADRVLQLLPLFHVVGLVTAFLPAALAGASVVVPDLSGATTRVGAALAAIVEHRVTVLPAEPTLYRQLDREPEFERSLATVRLMTSGSSALDTADLVAIRAATGQAVREGYGISEAAATVTSTLMCRVARPGSVGLPYRGVEIRIVGGSDDDADDDGARRDNADGASPGDVGSDDAGPDDGDRDDGAPDDAGPDDSGPDDGAAGPPDADSGTHSATSPETNSTDNTTAIDLPTTAPEATDPTADTASDGANDDAPAEPVSAPRAERGEMSVSVSAGEVGPIAIRGATLFSGYWPDGNGGPDADGWFVTGDIGYLDDSGELHMVDRVAETIVVAGFTVYPREVEDVLATHPYVADAAVVGVPGRGGETVLAALVAQPGTRPTDADLDDFIADKLAPFKRPAGYRLLDSLPRTEVGRLDRDAVRSLLTDDDAPRESLATPLHLHSAGGVSDPAPGLGDLGRKLPATSSRGHRSAQDTDEDLF